MMTTSATVMRVTPESTDAAPMIAYRPGVTHLVASWHSENQPESPCASCDWVGVLRAACTKSVPMLHVACYLLQAGGREGGEERRGEGRGGEGREGGREEVDLSRDLHNLQEESDEAADRRTDHHRRHQRARRNLQTCRSQLARRISAPAGA
jgi:hypothetical protein